MEYHKLCENIDNNIVHQVLLLFLASFSMSQALAISNISAGPFRVWDVENGFFLI